MKKITNNCILESGTFAVSLRHSRNMFLNNVKPERP